jgi:hypothetical protein
MRYLPFVLLFVCISCTPVATYPPIENDTGLIFSNSSNEPVPTIFAVVLRYAHEHFGGMDTIVFNLPEGVNRETYLLVSEKLNGAIPLPAVGVLAYYITELRKRPFHAEADILFPSSTGRYEQATLYLSSSLADSWAVSRKRVWLVPVNTLPQPNFPTSISP